MFFSHQRKYTCKMKQHLISVSWNSDKSPSEMFLLSVLQISHYWGRACGCPGSFSPSSYLPCLHWHVIRSFQLFLGWESISMLLIINHGWASAVVQAAVQIRFAVLVWLSQSQAGGILALDFRTLPEPGSCLGVSQSFKQMGLALQHGQTSWDWVLLALEQHLRII